MTALAQKLRELTDAGIEQASDVPESMQREIIGLWSAPASMDELMHAYLQPFAKTDEAERRFETLVCTCFHRYRSPGEYSEREFLRMLDCHIWREIESDIDDAIAEVLTEMATPHTGDDIDRAYELDHRDRDLTLTAL